MIRIVLLIIIGSSYCISNANYWFNPIETKTEAITVRAIERDNRGYLWVGNQRTGLMRYDGYNMLPFIHNPQDSSSISNNHITSILQDSYDQLWIGTVDGLNQYIPESGKFIRYKFNNTTSNQHAENRVNEIVESPDSTLWVLTQDGLLKYNRNLNEFTRLTIDSLRVKNFTCADWDKNGNMWCGLNETNGLYQFNADNNSFTLFKDTNYQNVNIGIKKLVIDSNNQFWYSHNGVGFAEFSPSQKTFSFFPSSKKEKGTNGNSIYSIIEADSVNIFIGIDLGGINVYNRKSREFTYILNKSPLYGNILSNAVITLYKDDEGIIWVGTARGGLCYYNPKEVRFNSYMPEPIIDVEIAHQSYYLPNGYVATFLEDSKGNIWIGLDGGGICVFDRKTKMFSRVQDYLPKEANMVRSINEDADGNIWLSFWNHETIKYNPTSKTYSIQKLQSINKVGLSDNNTWSSYIDKKNRFWLSLDYGEIGLYDENKKLINQFFTGDSVRYMGAKFFESEEGLIYIISHTGLYKYNESSGILNHIVKIKNLTYMDFDEEGNIYSGSDMDAVYFCDKDGKGLRKINIPIKGIIIQGLAYYKNNLYLSSNKGIIIHQIGSTSFRKYNKADGLQGNKFFMQSVLKTSDNELFFGGNNGFTTLNPNDFHNNTLKPQVYISTVRLISNRTRGKKIEIIDRINTECKEVLEFDWKSQMAIRFDFKAISLTFPKKNRYKYKLHGFDNRWYNASPSNSKATYTNLNPGIYTFQVLACNNDGLWNNEGRSLKVIIHPPFWMTSWFYTVCIVMVLFVIYIIIKYRERKIKQYNENLKKEVCNRTSVIQKQKEQLDQQNMVLESQYEELETSQEELQMQNEELFMHRNHLQRLVDDRTEELKKAKEKAEESDMLKSSFLANMSHEIRTPMNAIVGFSRLLEDLNLSAEDRKNYISVINTNSDSLLHLIEDILDFSLIESNQMKVTYSNLSVNTLLNSIYSTFAIRSRTNEVEFKLNNLTKDDNICIKSDEYRIRQIITNLLSNAIKFTDIGYIELGCLTNNDHLDIYVKDTGIGMSKAEQEMIFERFIKLDKDLSENKRGVGLGLSISKSLAELLEGELSVESTVGEGSTFTLSLKMK